LPESVTSLAVESARRAARAGVAGLNDPFAQTDALAHLIHTLTAEAMAAGVGLYARIDALTRALAVEIDCAISPSSNDDVAHETMKAAGQLARSQLNTLRILRRARELQQKGNSNG